jgi:hypothetical protein
MWLSANVKPVDCLRDSSMETGVTASGVPKIVKAMVSKKKYVKVSETLREQTLF